MRVTASVRSDVGLVRDHNEDGVFAGQTAFAVADGMGGHAAGEVASATALQSVAELDGVAFSSDEAVHQGLLDAVGSANEAVVARAQAEPSYRGMGTTLTAAIVHDDRLHLAHVGDSRAYLLRGQQPLLQLTTDHTVVEELLRDGRLTREQIEEHPQRAVITRAVGLDHEVEADSFPPLPLQPGDQVLLCSDGLTGVVDEADIAEILRSNEDGDAACRALVDAANNAGGPDNITVLLIRLASDAGTPPSHAASGNELTQELDVEAVRASSTRLRTGGEPGEPSPRHAGEQASSPAPSAVPPADAGLRPPSDPPAGPVAAPPSASPPAPPGATSTVWRRVALGVSLAAVVALLVAGASVLISRAWFVGTDDGTVVIFQGVPADLAGVQLHRVAQRTDLAVEDLAPRWQQRLEGGIQRSSAAEAERLVERLRRETQQAQQDEEAPGDEPTPDPFEDG